MSDLGIDQNDSSRWQAIARIPEDDFERHIAETITHDAMIEAGFGGLDAA